ncbi:MAG: septation protein A [Sphingomonadales bacterium]
MSEMTDQHSAEQDPKAALQRMLIEIGPLLVFILTNWKFGIMAGTGAFMVAMTAAIAYSWIKTRHVAPMLWVSFGFVLVFGGLTLYFDNEQFIKVKPTITNMLFALVLLGGYAFKKLYLKMLLGFAMPPMQEEGWKRLTLNWGFFFIFLAILNEIFWRSFSTETWLNLKLFAVMPITLVFSGLQIPVINKYMVDDAKPAG